MFCVQKSENTKHKKKQNKKKTDRISTKLVVCFVGLDVTGRAVGSKVGKGAICARVYMFVVICGVRFICTNDILAWRKKQKGKRKQKTSVCKFNLVYMWVCVWVCVLV